MKMLLRLSLVLAVLWTPYTSATAQELSFGGQIRPRFEYRNPYAVSGGDHESWISMRARAQVSARLERSVSVFLQVQDVRVWGEESNTLNDFSADNVDLHQGYVEVRRDGATVLSARAGRQEVILGNQRLVGAVNWSQQGRSFDGLRLSAERENLRVDLLGSVLANDLTDAHTRDEYFVAAFGQVGGGNSANLELVALYNRVPGTVNTDQLTMGGRWWGAAGSTIAYSLEGYFQTGERVADDVRASMFGARLGARLADNRATVTLLFDYLSGDDDPADERDGAFDLMYATNHQFYGLADFFTNNTTHTANRGLMDIGVRGSWTAKEDLALAAEFHTFRAAQSEGLSTGHFGEEVDLTAGYRYSGNFSLSAGFAYVFAADGWDEIGRLTENAVWSFMMVDVSF